MSRESMNMGSSNNNIISQLKATMHELQQGFSSMRQEASSFFSVSRNIGSVVSGFSQGGGGGSSNQVAPNPKFSSAPTIIGMTQSGNIVAAGPSASMTAGSGFTQQALPGMENLGQYVARNPGAGTTYMPSAMVGSGGGASGIVKDTANYDSATGQALDEATGFAKLTNGLAKGLSAYGLGSGFLPGTDETVQTDLLMKRVAFFMNQSGGQVAGGSGALANSMSNKGIVTSSLDSLNALAAAQSLGLSGGGTDFMGGVANLSKLIPGMGIEGAMRATGAMQEGASVNMLRGIGIQIRDADGTLKPPDRVIDDLWDKICRDYKQAYGSARNGGKPSFKEVQIALQPGNSLDSMLDQYFGSDPMLKSMVMNGILYRANSSGGSLSSGVDATVTSTESIKSLSEKYSATTTLLTANAPTGASGFTKANDMIAGMISTIGSAAATLLPIKTFMDTLLSASGGAPTNAISGLASLFKADGGPVQGNTAYIVGERGPELFVPGVSGTIVPNDQIQPDQNKNSGTVTGSSNNTYNFNINIPNANTPEVISALRKLMSDLETNKIVSES